MRLDLAAPHYGPAQAYHAPVPAPFEFGVDTVSLEEMLSTPTTREILAKDAPWALQMAQSEGFAPFRSTFTVRDAASFLPFDVSKSITAVDEALRALPQSDWPASVR